MNAKKTNKRYFLLGTAVVLAAYFISGWEDVQRGFNDAQAGRPYSYEQTK